MHYKDIMAFLLTSRIVFLVFMVLLVCLLHEQSSGQRGYSYANIDVPKFQNRRVLINDLDKNKVAFKSGVLVDGPKTSETGSGGKEMVVGWELREAPLGPDPLHHHGSSPKKPGTKTP